MKMDYDFADTLDLEWHGIFKKYLGKISYRDKKGTSSFDDILKEVFCSNLNDEQTVRYEDKDTFEKCLLEALNLLLNRRTAPRQIQIQYLLNIGKHVSKDETCFINLNSNNVYSNLVYISQPSTNMDTKLLLMEFLQSFLEHSSGVKWLVDTKYWDEIFKCVLIYQNRNDRIPKIGSEIIRVLLEKTIDLEPEHAEEIVKLLTEPLLKKAQQVKPKVVDCSTMLRELEPNIMCLVDILEGLLKNYSANVLHYLVKLQIGHTTDALSKKCSDETLSLLLDRITMTLSFFDLSEVFDGIKSIREDPLVLSGFTSIIDREVDKGFFTVVFELYYYALTYLKYIPNKLPTYSFEDKQIDTETQLVSLQLEPLLLEWVRISGATEVLDKKYTDLGSMSHPLQLFKNLCLNTLHIGFKIREKLDCSFEVCAKAVENISRSRNLYSKKNLCLILDTMVYSLEAPLKYIQSKKDTPVTIENGHQLYILALFDGTLAFIESFDINWTDSSKLLDLLYIVIEGSSAYHWIEPIMLDSLLLLQEIISRRFSPSMALLIDTAEGLKNIGPLLYKTCYTNEWKIRKEVMKVIHTVAVSANNCFSSYKTILFGDSLPLLISTMAFNDESAAVKATALKCIQQMITMEEAEKFFSQKSLISRLLDTITLNTDPEVTKEAVSLLTIIYEHDEHLDKKIAMDICRCLEHLALSNNNDDNLQKEVAEFWRMIIRLFLNNEGYIDNDFPAVTFSRRIVPLTLKEIHRRSYKVLSALSEVGCLNVFVKFWQFKENHVVAKKSLLQPLCRFHNNFKKYKLRPESMLLHDGILDETSTYAESLGSTDDSEETLEDIINDATMKMNFTELDLMNNEDILTLLETGHLNKNLSKSTANETIDLTRRVTPYEFVKVVYDTVATLTAEENRVHNYPSTYLDVYVIDY